MNDKQFILFFNLLNSKFCVFLKIKLNSKLAINSCFLFIFLLIPVVWVCICKSELNLIDG